MDRQRGHRRHYGYLAAQLTAADAGDQRIHPSVLRATHPLPQAVELVEQTVLGLAPEMLELLPQIAYPLAHVSGDLASTRRALGRQELTSGSLDQGVQLPPPPGH